MHTCTQSLERHNVLLRHHNNSSPTSSFIFLSFHLFSYELCTSCSPAPSLAIFPWATRGVMRDGGGGAAIVKAD